jgi:hypothetical protein
LGVLGGINLAQPVGKFRTLSLTNHTWADLKCEAGYIIQYSGYKTAFYAMGGAFGVALIMIFFWMPETAFVRTGTVNLDTGSNNVSRLTL